jgi:enterochelin esterase-like enzyme
VSAALDSTVLSGRRLTIFVPERVRHAAIGSAAAHVLVLHDGQNLFDAARAFAPGDTWRVAETADALIETGAIPPTVIAGVDHADRQRVREYGAGARAYGHFIVDEVLPYLWDTYRVRRDAAGTAMGGSSMGGLVTLRIASRFPGVFGSLLVLSPSVWWRRRSILQEIHPPRGVRRLVSRSRGLADDVRVWLSIGLQEGEGAVSDVRRLRDVILDARGGDTSRFLYAEDPDGQHAESSWARQLVPALQFGLGG